MCRVLLNSIEKVKRFVNITSDFETDVFLKVGRYVIDAKSILGIFSVDLTKPMELTFDIENKCDKKIIAGYIEQVKEFAV